MSRTTSERLIYVQPTPCVQRGKLPLRVMTCTCNPATFEAKFGNGVGSVPVWSNSLSRWVDFVTTCNPARGEETD